MMSLASRFCSSATPDTETIHQDTDRDSPSYITCMLNREVDKNILTKLQIASKLSSKRRGRDDKGERVLEDILGVEPEADDDDLKKG